MHPEQKEDDCNTGDDDSFEKLPANPDLEDSLDSPFDGFLDEDKLESDEDKSYLDELNNEKTDYTKNTLECLRTAKEDIDRETVDCSGATKSIPNNGQSKLKRRNIARNNRYMCAACEKRFFSQISVKTHIIKEHLEQDNLEEIHRENGRKTQPEG